MVGLKIKVGFETRESAKFAGILQIL